MEDAALVAAARLVLLGRLARGVVHELNNPLFVVLGLVELVLRDVEEGTKPHERLSLALSTGGEIRDLAATLGELAREGEAGEPETLPLAEPAAEAAALARRLGLAKEVEIAERYAPEPALVEGRRALLRQLFLALLVLAQRRPSGGATIALEVAPAGDEAIARVAAPVELGADAAFDVAAAEAIARLHDGSLAVTLSAPLEAELRLPLAAASPNTAAT